MMTCHQSPGVTSPLRSARIASIVIVAAALTRALAGPAPGHAQADSSALARAVAAVIDAGPLARAHWGIEAREVATGAVLYSRDAERLFVPASNLKLVVAAAAAHHLPPDFRYATGFLADGAIADGVLRGSLVVRGTGDPTLSGRYQESMYTLFAGFADSLRAHGVRRIEGGIVADIGYWPHEPVHGDWQHYDLNWWYAAPVGPLGFNDNSIDFRVAPGEREGLPARISWEPQSRAFTFSNRTRTVAAGRPHTLDFDRVPGTDSIFARGDIPLGTAARTEYFAVRDPAHYAATVLAEALARNGIALDPARVRVTTEPAGAARPIFEHRSPPLPQLLGPVLQTSQNWFAEQLLRTLGREVGREGSWQAGLEVETAFLEDVVGIEAGAFQLRDASGLSSGNLITPAALVQLLRWQAADARQRPALDALPVGGAGTGSLRSRFRDLPGRVRAKTGSVRNVVSLSGFLRTDSGREVAFSIIANGTGLPAARVTTAIDEVVRVLGRT